MTAPFDLAGRVALVTGAARGLGRAIALSLAEAGADVALGLRDPDGSDELVAAIEALGRRALPLAMDVTDLAQSRAAIDTAVAEFGRLDILVNNAGGGIGGAAIDVTEEDFDAVWQLNTRSTFFISQHAARAMRESGRRLDRQRRLAGRPRRASRRVLVLREQGRRHPHDARARRRVGRVRHPGQRGRTDVHRDGRHGCRAGRCRRSAPTPSSASPRCTGSAFRPRCPAPSFSSAVPPHRS